MNKKNNKTDVLEVGQHLVIEANAGTGKTYTIEKLVSELIESGRCKATEILLVTFTVKAAGELRARVRERLSGSLASDVGQEERFYNIREALALPDALWNIQTIHGFCQRTLLEFPMFTGTSPHFQLISESELVGRAIDNALRAVWLKDPKSPLCQSIRALRACGTSLQEAVEHLIQAWTSGYRSASSGHPHTTLGHIVFDSSEDPSDEEATKCMNAFMEAALEQLPAQLESYRHAHGLMTFNSMIIDLARSLESHSGTTNQLINALRAKYRVCIVDEFQDTDALQWEIFKKLFCESDEHSFVCVGDPKQSIYSFRGASLDTYLNATQWLLKDKKAIEKKLTENWRSSEVMIATVNEILKHDTYEKLAYTHPSTAARKNVGIWKDREMTQPLIPVVVMHMRDAKKNKKSSNKSNETEESEETEATKKKNGKTGRSFSHQIAYEIHSLMLNPPFICIGDETTPRPLRYSDIMVLTSGRQRIANSLSSGDQVEVAHALAAYGIPHWVYRNDKLFQLPEVTSLLDVLIAALTPDERSTRNRALLAPLISGRAAHLPYEALTAKEDSPALIMDSERFLRKIQLLLENKKYNALLSVCRKRLGEHTLLSARLKLNIETALERLCENGTLEGLGPWQAVDCLRSWIASGNTFNTDDEEDGTSALHIQGQSGMRNAVTIMTWHSSKGCEAPVVFATGGFYGPEHADFTRNIFIGKNDHNQLAVSYGKRYKIGRKDFAYNTDEQLRLQYVLLTRASVLQYLPCVHNGNKKTASAAWFRTNEVLFETQDQSHLASVNVIPIGEFDEYPTPQESLPESGLNDNIEEVFPLSSDELPNTLGVTMSSYSSLKKSVDFKQDFSSSERSLWDTETNHDNSETDDLADPHENEESVLAEDALADIGGKDFGVFVHSLYEELHWEKLKSGPESADFIAEVERVIDKYQFSIFQRFGADALPSLRETFIGSLTTPLCIAGVIDMPHGIWQADQVLCEVNFYLPEVCTPAATPSERFFKGFIDLIFSHNGKTYFADWKTDRLESKDLGSCETLQSVMNERGYALQLQLYSKALFRSLNGEQQPDKAYELFGGGVYLFIRYGEAGVYALKPSLTQLQNPIQTESVSGQAPNGIPLGEITPQTGRHPAI